MKNNKHKTVEGLSLCGSVSFNLRDGEENGPSAELAYQPI